MIRRVLTLARMRRTQMLLKMRVDEALKINEI